MAGRSILTLGALLALVGCGSSPSTPLDAALAKAAAVPHLTSLSVRENGVVVHEAYFGKAVDDATLNDVRSVTKTVTSLLIGAALDAGCVTSLDQPIGELLGDLAPSDPAKAAIRVRDILSMSSGLDWDESTVAGYDDWALAPDQVEDALAPALVATPGSQFNYNSGAFHLLSAILTHACAPTATFAAEHLFGPLGIVAPPWEIDNQGITNGAAGVQLTNPQLAAIGQLILDHGMLDGTQLISASYVDQMTTMQIATDYPDDGTPGYGLGIWLGDRVDTGPFALAEGFGGQYIAVVPKTSAVVVATTALQDDASVSVSDFNALFNALVTKVLPAL